MAGRVRLILAWGLFVAWVGWLGWLGLRYGRFPVVSKAQLLNASCVIVATVDVNAEGLPNADVTVVEVLSQTDGKAPEPGTKLRVDFRGSKGINGAGNYVLPLTGAGPYRLARVPRSPLVDPARHDPLVYPDTAEVRAQVANR